MKIACFDDNRIGLVLDDGIHDATAALEKLPRLAYPLAPQDHLIANLESVKTYEGTDDMHLLILGEAVTGLPAFA